MKEKLIKVVEKINSGEIEEVIPFFGSVENLFKILDKFNVTDKINFSNSDLDDYQNEIFYSLLNNSNEPNKYYDYIIEKYLLDVEKIGNDYFLIVRDLSELSSLFKSYSRDVSPQDVAKNILSDDIDWEPFWDTTDNVYSDVIEELNDKNLKTLKEKILKDLNGVEIEITGQSSEEMELIASEQGHDDHMFINQENIDRIVDDEDTMYVLLDSYLEDLKSDLYSIHSNSYNNAYYSEIYNDVWSELSNYFEGKPVWVQQGNRYIAKLKVTNSISSIIFDFLSYFKGYNDTIENEGYLLGLLQKLMDSDDDYEYLSFRVPDYPDYSYVKKNINEVFGEYI